MYKRLKRLTDILLAALLGLIFAPVLACIGTVILLESGRPIFFRQTRIGLYGRPFSIVKFRTLYVGAGKISHPLDQVTPFGRLLRRWGLDEIPQLWNVLKGEMSLVGPRPTLPEQVQRYTLIEKRRLRMRPGITGWAQIHGRNAIDWPARIHYDLEYVDKANLGLDLMILLRTPTSLLDGSTAYGPGGVNADFLPGASQQKSNGESLVDCLDS
jgi:lipopolysaccharide/colanic/teichoic acid biosynthesis glycosyltransferase